MKVKVVDFRSNSLEKDILESVINTGFVVLTNHGIEHDFIKQAQMAWRLFFLNKQEHKDSFVNPEDPNMGYAGLKKERAVGAKTADLKEFFHWKPGQKMPYEVWAVTQGLFYQLEEIGMKVLHILESHGDRTDYQACCFNSDNTLLRSLYYPAMDFTKETDAVRAAAHEDINYITLLVAASAPGLQVKDNDGNWHDVPHETDSIVVNMGDMIQLASRGLYKSTTHRVINPDNNTSDRVSMPLFIHPHSEVVLAEGVTAGQFLAQRLKEIYLKNGS